MTDIAIRAENLGKKYKIGKQRTSNSLREAITESFAAPLNLFRKPAARTRLLIDFWALQHCSFELRSGEVLGVIGHNGSGKSTLLKLLSRITRPTTGLFEVRGRMGALLEVGTGFHPDLTGRENVYLNGSMLGMKRQEIAEKFDSIVEFSGVEEFLDTPLKYYSSGMYVRLAFAVAAHLETDILVLDEVLSVGDLSFQRKSAEKIKSMTRDGRTVMLVSHSMKNIREICNKVMWLDKGLISAIGDCETVIAEYERSELGEAAVAQVAS